MSPNARSNNFDALRLIGALLVALGHSMDIALGYDGLGRATNNQSFGGLGLNIFCTISGFLIAKSRFRNDAMPFFEARALRIFPALWVALPLLAFGLGPMFTSLPLHEYLTHPDTWSFLATAAVFPLNPSLPGTFGGAPLVGQLYSLTAELGFYILVGLFGGWRHFPKLVAVLFVAVVAIFVRTDYGSLPFSHIFIVYTGSLVTFFFPVRLGLTCVYYLLAGCLLAIAGPSLEKLKKLGWVLFPIWLLALTGHDRRVYDMVEFATLPVVILAVGMASRFTLRIPDWFGDISYGMYIYHFAIALALVQIMPSSLSGWATIALALALSTTAGWASFRLVEKRALSLKRPSRTASPEASVSERAAHQPS
ncbi:MAG TPA: hypothetical protein DCM36_07840 [Xanthomonadaceae bacterium]|nr:hypothetical protein [Xanthomonadaceae bacterium]